MYNQIFEYIIIIVGALVIFRSFTRLESVYSLLPLIQEPSRKWLSMNIRIQRILLVVFLGGYFVVAITIYMGMEGLSNLIVSIILLLLSVSIYIGVKIKASMTSEILRTIKGLIPICAECKKIQSESNTDATDQSSWMPVDQFISRKTNAKFTHGLCPSCEKEMLRKYGKKE